MARYQRLEGRDVLFLTGTDEHGQKMQQTARKEGHQPAGTGRPQLGPNSRGMGALLNASNDDFIRTTEPRHHEAVQNIWNRMADAGDLYKDSYSGWYSVRDEAYYQEGETEVRADGVRLRAAGLTRRMGGGSQLFLQALCLSGQVAAALRRQSGLYRPG